jgi:GTP cyclohydrolase II
VSETKVSLGPDIELLTRHGAVTASHLTAEGVEGVVVSSGLDTGDVLNVRVQSSCVFSEALGSVDCDCAIQLGEALRVITLHGGLVVYLYDEGRGAGLRQKFDAIALQQRKNLDTVAAFAELGLSPDLLKAGGVNVVARRLLVVDADQRVRRYLQEKAVLLGHDIGAVT